MIQPDICKTWHLALLLLIGCSNSDNTLNYQDEFKRIAQLQTPLSSMLLKINSSSIIDTPTRILRPNAKTVGECWSIAGDAMQNNAFGEADCVTADDRFSLIWSRFNVEIHANGWLIPRQGAARKLGR